MSMDPLQWLRDDIAGLKKDLGDVKKSLTIDLNKTKEKVHKLENWRTAFGIILVLVCSALGLKLGVLHLL